MKLYRLLSTLGLLGLALSSVLITGCASASKPSAMVPQTIDLQQMHTATVGVAVSGGKETNPMWTSQISDEAFQAALSESILQSGLFAAVLEGDGVDYRLEVNLVDMEQPMMGFNMNVRLSTDWRIVRIQTDEVVFEKRILGSHTAKVGDAFVGVKRLRLANEGAARDNIRQGIEEVSELNL